MPRSSSHRSHRPQRHSSKDDNDRSDSDDDDRNSGERTIAGPRVSNKNTEPEKSKPSSQQEKDPIITSNGGDSSNDHRKKRKDRVEGPVSGDRWIGGQKGDLADKKAKIEDSDPADANKAVTSKPLESDSKVRSTRKRETSSERNESGGHSSKDAKKKDKEPRDSRENDRDCYKDERQKDAKERGRDHSKEAKERDKDYEDSKERDRDYKDAKERDRRYKDSKERDRDYKDVKERDKDYYMDTKRRGRDYSKDSKEKSRGYSKDANERGKGYKDAKESERDYSKNGKEMDREYVKDTKDREHGSERDKRLDDSKHERSDDRTSRRERQIQDDGQNPELEKEHDKRIRMRERSVDKEKKSSGRKDNDDKQLSSGDDHTKYGRHRDESHNDGRYRDKYRDDFDRDQKRCDDRGRDERHSRDSYGKKSDKKHIREEHDSSRYVDDHGIKLKDNRGRKRYYDEYDDNHQSSKEASQHVEKNVSYTRSNSHTDRGRLDHPRSDKVDSGLGSNIRNSSPSPSGHVAKDQSRKSLAEVAPSRGDNATSFGRERISQSRLLEKTKPMHDEIRNNELPEIVNSHPNRTPKAGSHTSPSLPSQRYPSTADWRVSDRVAARRDLDVDGQRDSSSKDERDYSNAKVKERPLTLEKSNSDDLSINSGPLNRNHHSSYEDENNGQYSERRPNRRYNRSSNFIPHHQYSVGNNFISHHQFPAPSLFGMRPSMDLNHTDAYHMHESAERFPPHVRPFGWPTPVGDSPHHLLRFWDGSNSDFGEDPHRYLMGSRGWEMNSADMWNGQNANTSMGLPVPQGSEYSANALYDKASAGTSGTRLECLPSDYSANEKNAVETPQRSIHELTPVPSKNPKIPETFRTPCDDIISYSCNYLSKLDISVDICTPELYKQCMTLLGTGDMTSSAHNVSKPEKPQSNKEDARLAWKGNKNILKSVFSTRTETVFQRAMSLYKKENEGRKIVYPASDASKPEEMEGVDHQMSPSGTSLEAKVFAVSEEVSSTNADLASDIIGAADMITGVKGDGEDSQPSEALMSDCMVNLNRIHLSPRSTH